MAYKDEYEVARLFTDTSFRQAVSGQFEGSHRIRHSFAPPLFARRDPVTGRLKKHTFGPWMGLALKLLARGKRLRGTWADPFGWLPDRKLERRLVTDFERRIMELSEGLTAENVDLAALVASLPMKIKGYGHVKDRNLAQVRGEERALMEEWDRSN